MKKFLLIATLSVIAVICRSEEYPVPPQFKVWGTTVPDDSENIAVPATLEEVLPSGGIVFHQKDMGAAGFYPFRINCFDKLHYTRTPSSAELSSPGVKMILAQGEYEPAVVGIYAAKSINLKATLSKITKADGTEFPASCLDLRWIRQIPYPYARGLWSMEPLILEKKNEKSVSAGQSIYLWITAFAPDKLPAGIYEGNILLTADGLPQQQVSVKFKVLPFSLPQTDKLFSMLYGESGGPDIRGNTAKMREEFIDMKEHGMNHLAYMGNQPKHELINDKFIFNFDHPRDAKYTPVSQVMKLAEETGLNKAFFPHYHGIEEYSPYPWRTPLCDQYYRSLFKAWQEEADKQKWPPIIQNLCDEPTLEAKNNIKTIEYFGQLAKSVSPGIRTSGFAIGSFKGYDETTDLKSLDIYIGGGGSLKELNKITENSKKFMFYNRVRPHTPLSGRMLGYLVLESGALGHQQFMYRIAPAESYPLSPKYIPANVEQTIWVFSYTGKDGLLPTVTFEAIREGIDDLRYVTLLETLLKEAEQKAAALPPSQAETVKTLVGNCKNELQEIKKQFSNFNSDGNSIGLTWQERISPEDFEVARYRVITMILKLRQAMGINNELIGEAADPIKKKLLLGIDYNQDAKKLYANTVKETITAFASSPPSIDGKLDDACWSNQQFNQGFSTLGEHKTPEFPAFFKSCYDKDNLYFAFFLADDQKTSKLSDVSKNISIWSSNAIEVFLLPQGNNNQCYHLAADYWGRIELLKGIRNKYELSNQQSVNPGLIRTAISTDLKGWYLEVAIPIKTFDLDGAPVSGMAWKMEIGRSKPMSPNTSWSPLTRKFAEPGNYGTMFWQKKQAVSVEYARLFKSGSDQYIYEADLRNHTAQPVKIQFTDDVMPQDRELKPGVNTCYATLKLGGGKNIMPITITIDGNNPQLLDMPQTPSSASEGKLIMPGVNDHDTFKEETPAFNLLQIAQKIINGTTVPVKFKLPLDPANLAAQSFSLRILHDGKIIQEEKNITLKNNVGEMALTLSLPEGDYKLSLTGNDGFETSAEMKIIK